MTELVFIMDRSGSMSGMEKDTIGGFNSMIEKQRREPGEAVVSTVLFDNNTEVKDEIKSYIEQSFGYDLNRTCDEIRPTYHHIESCQRTVPEAIISSLMSPSSGMMCLSM